MQAWIPVWIVVLLTLLAGAAHAEAPRGAATTPRVAATPPRDAATTPRGAETTPRDAATTPHDAATPPRGAETTPREAATTPRGAETAPRDAATTPRDAAAVAAYRAGDLENARTQWLQVLAAEPRIEGDERARVLFDLGNVAYRQGRTLESVGWYTAALRLRPRDADTWANLEHARREAKLEPADRGDFKATLRLLLSTLTPSESRLLALGGLLAWAMALAFEALRGGRAGRWLAIGGAGLALLASAPWLHGAWTHVDRPALVVEQVKALVRSEPRTDAAVVSEAPAGAEVVVVDHLPAWTKIRLADGTEGWVAAAAVFALAR